MVTTAGSPEYDSAAVYERRWMILGVLCLSLTVIGIDMTIVNVALPSIVRGVDASGSELQWIVDAYAIVFACLLLTAGALGDRFGRRGALLMGLGWFGATSAIASFSTSAWQLIIGRGLMGIGGAFIFPTTLSILTNVFLDPRERSRAIGIWAGVSGVGIAAGPLLGGLMVEHLGWHSVFWINAPVCALAFVLVVFIMPKLPQESVHPLDPVGAVLSIVGLVGLLYAIIEVPDIGWTGRSVVVGFVDAFLVLGAFAWWEARTAHPMLDVKFFKNPRFSAASATITLMTFALYASTFLLTLYFQFTLGYSPLKTGILITPMAAGMMLMGPQAPRLVERFGTKRVVMGGLTMVMIGLACYGSNTIMSSYTFGMILRFFYGMAMGCVGPPVTESIMGSVPKERAGVGSAVNDTTRQVGGALGVAVLGSIFASRYHAAMDRAALPLGLRHSARDSIGLTLQTAGRVTDPALAARVHDAGLDAFHDAMHVTYAAAVVVVFLAFLVAWKWLPAHAPGHDHESHTFEHPIAAEVDTVLGGLSVVEQ